MYIKRQNVIQIICPSIVQNNSQAAKKTERWQIGNTLVKKISLLLFYGRSFVFDFCLVYLIMLMLIMVGIFIEQSNGIYVDCQARCMLRTRRERNRDTLQMCRDECELIELLEQEDAREGKHYRYRQF